MINKIIFAVTLIIGLSFGIQVFAAQNITPREAAALNAKLEQMKNALVKLQQPAAQLNQSAPFLNKNDAMAINKGLEALKNVLVEINSALSSGKLSETDKKILSVALPGIVNSMAAISASLKNKNLPALAKNPPLQKSTALIENKLIIDEMKDSAVFDKKQTSELFSEQEKQVSSDNKQASLMDALQSKKAFWPAIIIFFIIAASVWLGRKKLIELKTKMTRLYSKAG